MTNARSANGSWKITASLRSGGSDSRATLGGTTTVELVKGWANFTDLYISHSGNNYVIDFKVTGLSTESSLKTNSTAITVGSISMDLTVMLPSSSILENQAFPLGVTIIDSSTKAAVKDIAWKVCDIFVSDLL